MTSPSTGVGVGGQNQTAAAAASALASTPVSVVLSVFVIIFIFLFFFVMLFRACFMVLNSRDVTDRNAITPEEYMLRRTQRSSQHQTPLPGLEPEIVTALPTATFSREKLRKDCCESFRECAVCLGEYEDGECIKTLPSCGHRFHAVCIDAWFSAHSTCPICRFNLKPLKFAGKDACLDEATDLNDRQATSLELESQTTIAPEAQNAELRSDGESQAGSRGSRLGDIQEASTAVLTPTAPGNSGDDVSIEVEFVDIPLRRPESASEAFVVSVGSVEAPAIVAERVPARVTEVREEQECDGRLGRQGAAARPRDESETIAERNGLNSRAGNDSRIDDSRRREELRRFLGVSDDEDSSPDEIGECSGQHVSLSVQC